MLSLDFDSGILLSQLLNNQIKEIFNGHYVDHTLKKMCLNSHSHMKRHGTCSMSICFSWCGEKSPL